jgi:hypothetical protein
MMSPSLRLWCLANSLMLCQFLILFGWEKFSVFDRVGVMPGIVEYWMCGVDGGILLVSRKCMKYSVPSSCCGGIGCGGR